MPQTLRFAICGCSCHRYARKLARRKVFIRKFGDSEKLFSPIPFQVEEVILPEDPTTMHRLAIRGSRSHFVVDHHIYSNLDSTRWSVELRLCQLISNGAGYGAKKGERVYIGGTFNNEDFMSKNWDGGEQESPPSIREILDAAGVMMGLMGPKRLHDWLKRMTPPGWDMVGYQSYPSHYPVSSSPPGYPF